MSSEQVTFGRFRFDLGRRELSRDGIPVRLGNRALDVLCVLAAAHISAVWSCDGSFALTRAPRASSACTDPISPVRELSPMTDQCCLAGAIPQRSPLGLLLFS